MKKSLFLDRDGVINVRKIGGYITCIDEFQFIDGVKQAMEIFNRHFYKIFVVTNQQGIGKGLMSEQDFETVSNYMIKQIEFSGGKIDKIYHCSALKTESSPDRKPNVGMAFKASQDFPDIVFSNSVMIGDSMSDMLFGKRCGMQTIFIDNKTEKNIDKELIDITFDSLISYALTLEN